MTNKIKTLISLLLAAGLMAFGAAAHAVSFTVELSTEFSGATEPEGITPWVNFTVDDGDTPGTVTFTIEATNLSDDEFLSAFYFNGDPDNFVGFGEVSAFIASIDDSEVDWNLVTTGPNCCSADGAGRFDYRWEFLTSNDADRFESGDEFSWTFTSPGIIAADFDFLNTGPGGNCCWTAAAHIQSIGAAGESGWIGGTDGGGDVPEPGTLALFGLGLTLMGVATRRRRSAPKT